MNHFTQIAVLVFVFAFASTVVAQNEGLADLDKAVERKMNVERGRDFERVVQLCEAALKKGLDEQNEAFARSILSGTLLERATGFAGPILEGKFDRNWVQRRRLALMDLDRAAKGNPSDGQVQLMIARLNRLPGGDADTGRAAAESAIDLLKDIPEGYSKALVARAAYQEDKEKRMADYDEAIRVDKTNVLAWRDRGRMKLANGKPTEAVEDFMHLLEQNPEDEVALQSAAEALADLGEFSKAREHLDQLIKLNPNEPSGYSLRARLLMMQENFDGAITDLDKALEIAPRDLVALMMRAQLNLNRGQPKKATSDLNRILQLRPRLQPAIWLRSVAHIAAKEYQSAINDLEYILKQDPDNVEVRLQLANVYSIDQRPRKAISIYNEMLEKDGQQWAAMRGRADAYLGIGKHREAIADYEQVLEHLPDESGVLNNFAWVLATSTIDEVRDGKRAIELATKACKVTDFKAAHILSTLAAAHAETGDFETAVEWSTKAVELGTGEVKQQLEEELQHFKEKKPWRERQVIEEKPDPPAPNPDDLVIEADEEDEPPKEPSEEDAPAEELPRSDS